MKYKKSKKAVKKAIKATRRDPSNLFLALMLIENHLKICDKLIKMKNND